MISPSKIPQHFIDRANAIGITIDTREPGHIIIWQRSKRTHDFEDNQNGRDRLHWFIQGFELALDAVVQNLTKYNDGM